MEIIKSYNNFINEKKFHGTGDEAFKALMNEIKADFHPDRLDFETWINSGKYVRYNIDDHRSIEIRFWTKYLGFFNNPFQYTVFFDAQMIDRDLDRQERERDARWRREGGYHRYTYPSRYWIEGGGDRAKPGQIHDVSQHLIRELCKFFFDQYKKYINPQNWFKRLYNRLFSTPPTNSPIDPYSEENWD